MKVLLLIICSIIVLTPVTMLLMTAYEEAEATHKLESQCINKYIQLGIERRDIDVSNGTCSLRINQKLILVINQKLFLPIYLLFDCLTIKTNPTYWSINYMQLLRVRDNGSYRDVTYRNSYPTWNLRNKDCPWESYEPLPNRCLIPLPKK